MNDQPEYITPPGFSNLSLKSQDGNTDRGLCISSADLLGDAGVATILHHGQRYQLRQTKAGKLILTK
ncbi:hemin uptake protein HemP [Ewingella sp. S1.OA.A_B6]